MSAATSGADSRNLTTWGGHWPLIGASKPNTSPNPVRAIVAIAPVSFSRAGGELLVARVQLVTNPPNDEVFAREAQGLLDKAATPQELERLLRPKYVNARVFTGVTDVFERWYAYREGSWKAGGD